VQTAASFFEATTCLRAASYSLAIFDQHLIEAEPNESETALAHLGDASSLDVNFAITGMERLADQVQAALKRRARNQAAARAAAAGELLSEIKDALATILLECDLALELGDLPAGAAEKLLSIHEAGNRIRTCLETAQTRQN